MDNISDSQKFINSLEKFDMHEQKDKLRQVIDEEINKMTTDKQSVEHTIDHIKKAFQSLSGEVKKFVLTLGSYFLTIAQKALFEEAGIEEYQITSVKDDRTCPQCTEMDGRHFKLKEFAIAQTAPPFHFFCRCMIIPYDSNAMQDEGDKSWYNADGSMNYPPNNGAVPGTEKAITLQPGQTLGRYGEIGSKSDFATATGASPNSLSLPPNTNPSLYTEIKILKPIPGVTQSTVAEWPIGSGTGGGIQYQFPKPLEMLKIEGYISY